MSAKSFVLERVNRAIDGEQDRERNRRRNKVILPPSPIIVVPPSIFTGDTIPTDSAVVWGCDFSGQYDGIVDCEALKRRGARFVLFKAADGTIKTRYIDENVMRAKDAGLITIAYFWLYRNQRISGGAQARAWWEITGNMRLDAHVVDFEWTSWMGKPDNPESSDLYGVCIPFGQLSGKKLWIYSAKGYMDEFFNHALMWKEYRLIQAQYGRIPLDPIEPWGNNGHTIHQISENWDGSQLGVDPYASRSEDGDIFNGTVEQFNTLFNITTFPPTPTPPPPAPIPVPLPTPVPTPIPTPSGGWTFIFGGAARLKSDVFNGAVYHLMELDLDRWDLEFDDGVNPCTTTYYLASKKLDIAINGLDGWYTISKGRRRYTYLQGGMVISKGQQYGKLNGSEQALYFNPNNNVSLDRLNSTWSACCFPNMLVLNGVVQPINKPVERRARTAVGFYNRKAYLLAVDGGDYADNRGWSVQDTAIFMSNYSLLAVLADSGGSTTMVVKGEDGKPNLINIPYDDAGVRERPVVVHMGWRLK